MIVVHVCFYYNDDNNKNDKHFSSFTTRMATPVKSAKKANKKYIPVKTSFNSPFSPSWSPLPQNDMHFILKTLKDKILSTGLVKKEVKVFRPWKKKKAQLPSVTSEAVPQVTQDAESQEAPRNGWSDVAVRRQLAIGINEVTKALERNDLKLLLVCKSVRPKHMTNHLIALSMSRGVPACQVPRLSQSLSVPLGLKSVLALGFRQSASKEEEAFTDTIEAIKPKVPPLDVPWLSLKPEEEEEEKEVGEKKGQKRKLEAEVVNESSSSSATLQPLKVKRVIANPSKQTKKKKRKS